MSAEDAYISPFARLRETGARGLGLLRLRPFELATAEGRGRERHRRLALTSIGAIGARVLSTATALVTVPLTVRYLGTERYGLWMTISSVIVLLGFADLGMGNGLLNAIAGAHGRNDRSAAQRSVSSAFFLLAGIAALIAATFVVAYPFVDWARVFNVTSPLARAEAGPAVAVFVAFLCLNLPLDIVQRVQQGYQEGFVSHVWSVAGSLLSLVALILVTVFQGGLPWLVAAMSGGPALVLILNWSHVFLKTRPWLFPRIRHFDWRSAHELAGSGAVFLLLSIFALASSSSDNLIIAHVLGPSAVASYAITQKLFLSLLLSQYFAAPLWPAFGEALARHDYAWARRTLKRALRISATVGICTGIPLILLGGGIIRLWVGPQVVPSVGLLIGFACWLVMAGYGGVMSSFLNAESLLRRQLWFYGAASITSVVLKVLLAKEWGVAGVIWATVIAFAVLYAGPAARVAFAHLREAEADWRSTQAAG